MSHAFRVSFNLKLQSQSRLSLFNGTWQKRPLQSQSRWSLFNGTLQKRRRKLDYQRRFEIEEMAIQMQSAVLCSAELEEERCVRDISLHQTSHYTSYNTVYCI